MPTAGRWSSPTCGRPMTLTWGWARWGPEACWLAPWHIGRSRGSPQAVDTDRHEQTSREALYYEELRSLALETRDVVVLDDGLATGSSAMAAAQVRRTLGVATCGLAAPVGPAGAAARLAHWVTRVEILHAPLWFDAVSQAYRRFEEVSAETLVSRLRG